jgi:predicted nucleotidyltransferase
MTLKKINYLYETILLLLQKDRHQRELAKELSTSLTRIQSIIKDLEEMNVIDYKEAGKNHVYYLKKNLIAKSFILNAENYKLTKLLKEYAYMEPIFKEILLKYPDSMILLFGSYAKGTEKEYSDIDLYIDATDETVKSSLKYVHDALSVQVRPFDKDDLLIKEIIKNHVVLQGGEKYYEKLGFFA